MTESEVNMSEDEVMSGPGLGLTSAWPRPLASAWPQSVDRELILDPLTRLDSSRLYGPMGHSRGLPLVACLDTNIDESRRESRRVILV